MNKIIKHAMIICVGNRSWNFPKHILMETDGKTGERLDDIAKRTFKRYKNSQTDKDVYLVSYTNYGDVEVFENNK